MTINVSKQSLRVVAGILAVISLCFQGCQTDPASVFAEMPGETAAADAGGAGGRSNGGRTNSDSSELIGANEPLTITFSDTPSPIAPFDARVKDDGTITLIYNQTFTAAGKTRGELEKEIRARYVPAYFINLTVTIRLTERLYFVGGEVKSPNRYAYLGRTTVIKAIQSAGDFTEWASKRRVRLTRSDGRMEIVDCIKAMDDPRYDREVYPGDNIIVPRRSF